MQTDHRNRCDQIIELIDRCLAECEASTSADAEDAEPTAVAA